MKKLSYSEMKDVKGGGCPNIPSCIKWELYGGVCNYACTYNSSGGSGYSGGGGGAGGNGNGGGTPYYP